MTFAKSTLLDLGKMLPIGVPSGNPAILEKGFAFKPYRFQEERELDKIRNKKDGAKNHPGKIVESVLAHMLTEWGGDTEFSQKSEKVRRNAVRNAYMADVLYAYVMLRIEAMGSILGVKVACPHCEHEWKWRTDLEGLEIDFVERLEEISDKLYELRSGLKYGEKSYNVLSVAPPTWAAVSDIPQGTRRGGNGDIKARMILSSIRQATVSGDPKAPAVSAGSALLNGMIKRDVEELTLFIDESFPNVDLSMEIECPKCESTFGHAVQWNWDFFFSSSSLPSRTTR